MLRAELKRCGGFDSAILFLIPVVYVDDRGEATERYPFNPNGSLGGNAGFCSSDGRILAMMPHPERTFLLRQFPWLSREFQELKVSPWLRIFQNAWEWCDEHR